MSPTQPPTANVLLQAQPVLDALEQAWTDSEAADPARRHEEGGWIYQDQTSGELAVERAARGNDASIDLNYPPLLAGKIVVGKFHTHPNPSAEGWIPGPSPADRVVDAQHGVPDLIRSDQGIH